MAQSQPASQGLIGRSAAFQRMLGLVARVAPSRATVLLLGESGTGKELVARAVHEASPRASKPLVAVDCGCARESRSAKGRVEAAACTTEDGAKATAGKACCERPSAASACFESGACTKCFEPARQEQEFAAALGVWVEPW